MGIGTKLGWLSTGEFSELIGNPVVRSGITAWVSNSNPYFLIDSFSYGGNSGSPVFARNIGNRGPFLIGIVCGHLGEELNEQNMSSGGNSGLAKCLFMDDVFTLIRSFDGDN